MTQELVEKKKENIESVLDMIALDEEGALGNNFSETKKILSLLPVGVAIVDRKKTIRWINDMALTLLKETSFEDVVGKKCHEKFCPNDQFSCPIINFGEKLDTSERVLVDKNGIEVPILKTVLEVNIEGEDILLEIFQDITRLKKLENELKYYATTDTLTGVFNRRTGMAFLEKQLYLAKRKNCFLTICYGDINGLKKVNDTFGHKEGDELILLFSKIFNESIRESDVVCRLGGDEFLLIFPDCTEEQAFSLWKRILHKADELNKENFKPYPISISGGLATYDPTDAKSLEDLIDIADKNMYAVKVRYHIQHICSV